MVHDLAISAIPPHWTVTTLGQYLDINGGTIQTGPFGSQLHASDYVEQGIPSVMPKNITVEKIDDSDIARISVEDAERLSKYLLQSGDIIYSRRGDVEKCSLVTDVENGWLCGTGCLRVRLNCEDKYKLSKFLHAYLSSPMIREWISRNAVGATMPNLNTSILRDVPLIIPEPYKIDFIGSMWTRFNNKITLNRQINQTLEQMAQALFKSWFVDFDPVIDNALDAGFFEQNSDLPEELLRRAEQRKIVRKQPDFEPLPAETRQLFPAAFEECEEPSLGLGGWVPKGWAVSSAGDEFTVKGGSTPSTKNAEFWEGGNIHWTSPKDLSGKAEKIMLDTEKKITATGLSTITSGLLPSETVLMSSRAPVGYLAMTKIPVAINQGYIAITESKSLTQEFALYWLDSRIEMIKSISGGTTFAEISKKTFRTIPMVVPSFSAVNAFSETVALYLSKIAKNVDECRSLSALRDTLLPKLISGELEII
ncbi:restriction endonuclease subunit S [Plesiomonas sp.]|uniref:restriction endonuclease subunit S n=1 Tax=Plesiomonas sp. TaxID=2486279 RepID=UPI003F3CC4FA